MVDGTLQRVETPVVGVQFYRIVGQALPQVILLRGEGRQLLTERSLFRRDAQLAHLRVAQTVAATLAADLGEVEAHLDLFAFLHLSYPVVGLPVVAAQGVALERQRVAAHEDHRADDGYVMVSAVGVGTVGSCHGLSLDREEILAGRQTTQCALGRADTCIQGVLGAFLLDSGRGDVAVAGTELQIVLIAREAPAAALEGPRAARAHLAVVQLAPGAPVAQRRANQAGAVHLKEIVNLLGEQRLQFHHIGKVLILRIIGQDRLHELEGLDSILAPFGQVLVGQQLVSIGDDALQTTDVVDLRDGHHLDLGYHHAGCEALGHEYERRLRLDLGH